MPIIHVILFFLFSIFIALHSLLYIHSPFSDSRSLLPPFFYPLFQPTMAWHRLARLSRRYISSLPEHKEVIMPKVSPTMTAGRLICWKKEEGESFEEGDEIADVESDKATMPISAREDGFMARILVQADTPDIPLGQVLAITVEEEADVAAFKDYQVPGPTAATPEKAPVPLSPSSTPPQPPSQEYTGPIGPAVMRLYKQFPNLNLAAIPPTGPKGRLLKGDVLLAIENGAALSPSTTSTHTTKQMHTPVPPPATPLYEENVVNNFTDVPLSSMRKAIAKRLVQSKTTVPHRYSSATYELDALLSLRKRLNARDPLLKISVNDFVIRAVGISLRRVPEMNAHWNEANKDVVLNDTVDVSMAVAVSGGLITPIVKGVDRLGLADVARTTKELVERARAGILEPEEYEGGSFSISNLGMYGITMFSAIINPPQSGILAVGGGGKFLY